MTSGTNEDAGTITSDLRRMISVLVIPILAALSLLSFCSVSRNSHQYLSLACTFTHGLIIPFVLMPC